MITRAMLPALLEPKISTIWFEAYPEVPTEYPSFVNIKSTRKATITDFKMTDFGALRLKGEGENVIYDDVLPGQTKAVSPVRFALGYKITEEMLNHELYGLVERFEMALMRSAVNHQEVTAHLLLNNGFGTTNADGFDATGFDGLALFSTAHTRLDGGAVLRNRPSTDVDISVTGVQNMLIDFHNLVNDRGRPQQIRPRTIIVNPEDMFTAQEILQSEYKPGTANNDVNALRDKGLSFQVSHYLSDADAWYVFGDKHDCNFVWDVRPRSAMQDDFDSEVTKRKVVQGYIGYHGEWRGTWASSGG